MSNCVVVVVVIIIIIIIIIIINYRYKAQPMSYTGMTRVFVQNFAAVCHAVS